MPGKALNSTETLNRRSVSPSPLKSGARTPCIQYTPSLLAGMLTSLTEEPSTLVSQNLRAVLELLKSHAKSVRPSPLTSPTRARLHFSATPGWRGPVAVANVPSPVLVHCLMLFSGCAHHTSVFPSRLKSPRIGPWFEFPATLETVKVPSPFPSQSTFVPASPLLHRTSARPSPLKSAMLGTCRTTWPSCPPALLITVGVVVPFCQAKAVAGRQAPPPVHSVRLVRRLRLVTALCS